MRLAIEIVAALLLLICVTVTSAASAADRPGRTADGLGCHFSLPQGASLPQPDVEYSESILALSGMPHAK